MANLRLRSVIDQSGSHFAVETHTGFSQAKLWLKLNGILPASPSDSRSRSYSPPITFLVRITRAWARPDAASPWRAVTWKVPASVILGYIAEDKASCFIVLGAQTWGGGQWRYDFDLDIKPNLSQTSVSAFISSVLYQYSPTTLHLRLEAAAPVLGSHAWPPPWAEAVGDADARNTIIDHLEYQRDDKSWQRVPRRGEANFPLAVRRGRLSEESFELFAVMKEETESSHLETWPRWSGRFGTTSFALSDASALNPTQHKVLSQLENLAPIVSTRSGVRLSPDQEVYQPDEFSSPTARWRLSRGKSDLMRVTVTGTNTLTAEFRIVARLKGEATPQPTEAPALPLDPEKFARQQEQKVLLKAKLTVETNDTPSRAEPVRFLAGVKDAGFAFSTALSLSGGSVDFWTQVRLYARFADGKPAGIIENDGIMPFDTNGNIRNLHFRPGSRLGKASVWAEIRHVPGAKVIRSNLMAIEIVAPKFVVVYSDWKPSGQSDEFFRWVGVHSNVVNAADATLGAHQDKRVSLKIVAPHGTVSPSVSWLSANTAVASPYPFTPQPNDAHVVTQFFHYDPARDTTRQLNAYRVKASFLADS